MSSKKDGKRGFFNRISLTRLLGEPTLEDAREITRNSIQPLIDRGASEETIMRVVLAIGGIPQPPLPPKP